MRVLSGFVLAQRAGLRVPILPMPAGSNRDWHGWRASSTYQEDSHDTLDPADLP